MAFRITAAVFGSGLAIGIGVAPAGAAEIILTPVTEFEFGDFASTGLQAWQLRVRSSWGYQLTAVLGDADSPMTIQTDAAGGFFNAADFGQGHFRASPALYSADPALQWDTFVTIGEDLALAGGGHSIVASDNLAWFDADPGGGVIPPPPADSVLIAQLVFAQDAAAWGTVNVQAIHETGVEERWMDLRFFIPAPGAVGVLGLWFVRGRRRR